MNNSYISVTLSNQSNPAAMHNYGVLQNATPSIQGGAASPQETMTSQNDVIATSNWWFYVRGCIATMITLGIIGSNVINLKIWWRNTRMPWATRRFLMNLSSCDLLVGLIATSSAIYPAFTGRWPYGDVWCQVTGIMHGMSVTLSIWSIAMVGIDRYIAAVKPFAYTHIMSRPCSCRIIIGMWLASALTYISPLFTKKDFKYYEYSKDEAMCGLYWEYPEYCIITALYIPCLSAVILVYTSFKIRQTLAVHNAKPLNYTNKLHYSKQRIETNKRALKIVMATSICYFIMWGPYVILTIMKAIDPSVELSDWLTFIIIWTANGNSMLNVFIYSFTNTYFQAEAKNLFGLHRCFKDITEPQIQDLLSKENHSSERGYQLCVLRRDQNTMVSAQTLSQSNSLNAIGQTNSTLVRTSSYSKGMETALQYPNRYCNEATGDSNEQMKMKRTVSLPARVYVFATEQESCA